jgi:hypothetical protein
MKKIVQCAIGLVFAAQAYPSLAVPSVLTQGYDNFRTGSNPNETTLTPSNVSSSTFGKLFTYPVDEEIFAQPLYVPGLSIGGGTHNVVFIATMGNTVYAFDADSASSASTPLWSLNLGAPVPSSKFTFIGGSGYSHNGIYSTPVINPSTNTMYVVSMTWTTATQSVTQKLHAIDILTGTEVSGSPVTIAMPGFNADVTIQRSGLMLLNGTLYMAFASHADLRENVLTQKKEPYVGLVAAYNPTTLALEASFNAEENGLGAAIWQGGRGLVSDGTYVYAATANMINPGSPDYSENFVQLNAGTLTLASSYVDPDQSCLNTLDLDLSSSGPQIIPANGADLLVGGGKEGKVYIVNLGESLSSQTPAYFWGTSHHPTLPAEGGTCTDTRVGGQGYLQGSDTAVWSNPSGISYYYTFGNNDLLYSWQLTSSNSFEQTSSDSPANKGPNGVALSANGSTNGILWMIAPQASGPAILYAYNATPASGHLTQLWNSTQVAARDTLGFLGRYSIPTIANGKVYVATGSNQVAAYGLLSSVTSPSFQITPTPATLPFSGLNHNLETINVTALDGYTGTITLTVSGLPAGVTGTFSPASGVVTLTSSKPTATIGLTINPAAATLPMNDNYTLLISGSASGGLTATAPVRLLARSASYPSATVVGCNAQNQMSVDLSWLANGSSAPSIWIQDPVTPTFPGRLWVYPAAASGSQQTSYSIDSANRAYFYWVIDQSNGIAATFDNAFAVKNLGVLYNCP